MENMIIKVPNVLGHSHGSGDIPSLHVQTFCVQSQLWTKNSKPNQLVFYFLTKSIDSLDESWWKVSFGMMSFVPV